MHGYNILPVIIVFTGVVKIRKGQAVEMIMGSLINLGIVSTLYRYTPIIKYVFNSTYCMHRAIANQLSGT